jgi:TolB-like protein/Flp pilus assembly protein TadD
MSRRWAEDLLHRRVPHALGIYLAGGWGVLEFANWATVRFGWLAATPDVVMGLWFAALPVVVALAWRYGAPGPQHGPLRVSADPSKSVAVLPFENLSDEPGSAFLADGLADEILLALARIPELRVASRTSAFAYRGASEDVRDIGRALGVGAVLEGTLQRSLDRLRITTRLVSVADGYNLWAQEFDREMEDWFEIEREIAQNVARSLRVLLAQPEHRVSGRVPPSDIRAYECYIRGREYLYQMGRKSLGYARDMFRRAIALDPGYALAWAGFADALATTRIFYPDAEQDLAAAEEAARKAMELEPTLAEAHSAAGSVLALQGRLEEAEERFSRAIELDPGLWEAHYYFARDRFQHGEFERAAKHFDRANEVRGDPDSAFFGAQSYEALGDSQRARAAYENAAEAASRRLELHPDDARTATILSVALCRTGQAEAGLAWARRALAIDSDDAGIRYNVACLYAVEGQPDRALECLEMAIHRGFGKRDWFDRDPDLDPLRSDPRFQTLMEEAEARVLPRP